MFKVFSRAGRVAVVAAFLFSSTSVFADSNALYLDVGGGVRFIDQPDLSVRLDGLSPRSDVSVDTGYNLRAALGYEFAQFWRLEAEIAHRNNDFEGQVVGSLPTFTANSTGDVSVTSLMANLYFAVPLNPSSNLVVGGGVGWARFDVDLKQAANSPNPGATISSGTDNRFAYQLKVTYEHKLTDLFRAYVGYNYFATAGSNFSSFNNNIGSVKDNLDYEDHAIIAGVRVRF